ncbi:MAG: alpha/beta fold hydrolase, partial [Bacteroidetes bacterium]
LDTEEFRLATTFTAGQALHELEEAAIAECAEKIREAGAEITFYNAVEVAHDFEALRLALGYNQWNIRGLSYGTRHTMTQIQQYPQTVRSAILIGMYPLKNYYDRIPVYLSRSLRILFEYCENDADCSEAFPDPEAELIEVLQRIDNNPIPLPAFLQRKIGEGDHFITSSMIFGGVFNLLYQKNGIEILPILIHQLAQGNDWIVQNMSLAMANTWAAISTDINFILRNNDEEEDPSFLYPGEWDNLALQLNEFYWGNNSETSLNRFWPELRGSQMAPTEVWEVSGVPVLLISGELDPVTPPSNGDKFAEYFTNYAHHIIPGSGHYPHADADINFAAFFDDPDPVRFDIHSHMEVQPLQLVTDVRVNRGISTTLALVGAGMYQRMILPGIAILLCLFGLIYFPVRFLVRKIRSKTYEGLFKQKLTVWLASFLNLVVVVLYALAIMDALNTNPYILAIGLPAKWIFIRAVIVVLAIILVVGLVNMKSIWKSKVRVKIPSVLSLLGGIGFTLFVFLSGMF